MPEVDELKLRVQQILLENDLKLQLTKDAVMVPYESTTVAIMVYALGEHTVVQLRGLVSQDVPISDELKFFVAEKSGAWIFGHPIYMEIDGKAYIEFRHALLGDFLDPGELLMALSVVANTSDELDDEIHNRFGGERWIDPHPTS